MDGCRCHEWLGKCCYLVTAFWTLLLAYLRRMLLAPILACLIFPLDNTPSSCEDKSNTFFLYYFEFRRRNSLRHNLDSNLYLLFIKRPFGLFDTSVSGLHPTTYNAAGHTSRKVYNCRERKISDLSL